MRSHTTWQFRRTCAETQHGTGGDKSQGCNSRQSPPAVHSSHKALDLRPLPSLLSLRYPLFKIPVNAKPLLGEHSNSSCIFSHTATCKQLGRLCDVNLVKLMHTFSKDPRRAIRRYQKTPQLQKLCPDNTQVQNGTHLKRTGSWIDTLHVSSWEPLCYHI